MTKMQRRQINEEFDFGDVIVKLIIEIAYSVQLFDKASPSASKEGGDDQVQEQSRDQQQQLVVQVEHELLGEVVQPIEIIMGEALVVAGRRLMGAKFIPAHADALRQWYSHNVGQLTKHMLVYAYEETALNTSTPTLKFFLTVLNRCVSDPQGYMNWGARNARASSQLNPSDYTGSGKYAWLFNRNRSSSNSGVSRSLNSGSDEGDDEDEQL